MIGQRKYVTASLVLLKTRVVGSSIAIAGAVMGVLQIALAVEVMVFALRRLGVIVPGVG
jgi:hypothetical protein